MRDGKLSNEEGGALENVVFEKGTHMASFWITLFYCYVEKHHQNISL